jgi:hypothetical protein
LVCFLGTCILLRLAPIVVYVQELSTGDCSTSKLALFIFVWIWDERSFRSRRESGARGRAIETGLNASTTTDLAAVRGVDAGPYSYRIGVCFASSHCASCYRFSRNCYGGEQVCLTAYTYIAFLLTRA